MRKLVVLLALLVCQLPTMADDTPVIKNTFTLWQLPNQTPTQMMSYVIKTPNGQLIVVDGGNVGDAPYLAKFLEAQGNEVAAWFMSLSKLPAH
jgi:hypothetical protein